MPTPLAFMSRIMANRLSTSRSVMEEVGSSMMRMRAFWEMALAISTICWSATRRLFILALGLMGIFSSSSSSLVCLYSWP